MHRRRFASGLTAPQKMLPAPVARDWAVPPMESVSELAEWLGLSFTDLEWMADLKGLNDRQASATLRHYNYRILAKISGSIRLIESPKARLKAIQRQILSEILERIPTHPAVHGFIKEKSIKTFAAPHAGRYLVLRMDLRDFFPSFPASRVQSFFRTAGYPETVADRLGALCTTSTPRDIWTRAAFGEDPLHLWEGRGETRAFYTRRHLPQGAPTSPALANVCAYRLDCRLAGLAESAGAVYTRYADDLAFSGDERFAARAGRFSLHVAAIAEEEGFNVNHRKTRIMRQAVRQHLAGLVVNRSLNLRRADFDRLKATLVNCVRHGPASQNREGHEDFQMHLRGRISFAAMINPAKALRLEEIFSRIQW